MTEEPMGGRKKKKSTMQHARTKLKAYAYSKQGVFIKFCPLMAPLLLCLLGGSHLHAQCKSDTAEPLIASKFSKPSLS